MKTKLLAMLLCLGMVMAMFAGCGSTASSASEAASEASAAASAASEAPAEEETEEAAPAEEEAAPAEEEAAPAEEASAVEEEEVVEEPAYFPLAETESFSYFIIYPPMFEGFADGPEDYLYYQEAEERLNVTIEFQSVPIPAASENFMLMIAGGDYTDAILNFNGNYSGSADEAVENEILLDLTDYIEDWAPNYNAERTASQTRLLTSLTEAGRQTAIFGFQTNDGRMAKNGPVIRKDWLDELGLEMPETIDEYHDVLTAFKENYGCASAYGLAADGTTTAGNMQGAYDIVIPSTNDQNGFYVVDGEIHWGPIEDAYKDMLTTENQWYTEGLISSDFVSDTNSATSGEVSSDRIANGEVGIWRGYVSNFDNYNQNIGGNANVVGISPMRLTSGQTLHLGAQADTSASNMAVSITTACENPETVVRFFDWFFTDEGELLANYGVEGMTFEYNDAGDPVYTEMITNNPDGMTMDVALCLYTGGSTSGPYVIDNSKNYYVYSETQMDSADLWNSNNDGAYQLPDTYTNILSADEKEELNTMYPDIITTYNENVLQFITGTRSLDEFDDFRDQLIDMGIEDCIDIMQGAYDRYMEKANA